jgi:hypothetical protein
VEGARMEKEKVSFRKKRVPVIAAFVLTCIIMSLLISCRKPDGDLQIISSDISETSLSEKPSALDIAANVSEKPSVSNESVAVSEIKKTPAEKITAGEVTNITDSTEPDKISYPLAKWYIDNMLSISSVSEIKYLGNYDLKYIRDISLYYADYIFKY